MLSQLKDCRTQITVLLSAAEKQASEFESKVPFVCSPFLFIPFFFHLFLMIWLDVEW